MTFRPGRVVPIPRIFSIEKAREFCLDDPGIHLDWEHLFDENAPRYRQVSRDGLVPHHSEHSSHVQPDGAE